MAERPGALAQSGMSGVERFARARATQAVRFLLPDWLRRALRYRLIAHPLTRRLYEDWRELDMVEARLRNPAWNGRDTAGMTERVVEIPWVLSRYRGERRVLDIGPAFALPVYLQELLRLGISELHGVDLAPIHLTGMTVACADVRTMPYPDEFFDLITCVSTLEHIGRDNTQYGVSAATEWEGDLAALREMRRVLRRAGRILITVPFGRLDVQSWQKQYDVEAWESLVRRAGLKASELEFYRYTSDGWQKASSADELASSGYREGGAPGATGLCCAELARMVFPPRS